MMMIKSYQELRRLWFPPLATTQFPKRRLPSSLSLLALSLSLSLGARKRKLQNTKLKKRRARFPSEGFVLFFFFFFFFWGHPWPHFFLATPTYCPSSLRPIYLPPSYFSLPHSLLFNSPPYPMFEKQGQFELALGFNSQGFGFPQLPACKGNFQECGEVRSLQSM
jgi:hypothetical protein